MSAGISALRIPATGNHTASVIWLHGLGDSGRGWEFLKEFYNMPHVKWILPNAPPIPISINAGMRMPGWFDIYTLGNIMARQDEDGILKSVNLVHRLITEEVDAGIPSDRIIVGGFSQGCAIAIVAGYTCERKLAGIAGLSGWLPLHDKFSAMRSDTNLKTPMFQAHGDSDPIVDFKFGQLTHEKLKSLGIDTEFHTYERMGHEAQHEEMNDLGKWLKQRIPNEPSGNSSGLLEGKGKEKV